MPPSKILELDGVKIRIWLDDHEPAHFHVIGPGFNFKVSIEHFKVIGGGYNRKAKKILDWAKENQKFLQAEWEKRHG